jgi:hypothetical protein
MRLLQLTDTEIEQELNNMDDDIKSLRDEALRICWYMRGSISYSEAMMLSSSDRTTISKIIKDNMETTHKTGLPFF